MTFSIRASERAKGSERNSLVVRPSPAVGAVGSDSDEEEDEDLRDASERE